MLQAHKMTGYSLIGLPCGKSIQRTRQLTQDVFAPLTEAQRLFLKELAPRAFQEVTQAHLLSKVMVLVLFSRAISDGLTVVTTFSISTPRKHFHGLMKSLNLPDSQLSDSTISETTQLDVSISAPWLAHLEQLSGTPKHELISSTYPVLTSQKIIHAEALALHVL